MSFSIFNSFNGNSCKLGQNYSIVSQDINPPTTVTYISADASSVTFSFTAPTTSGTILSYTPYINGSVASGSGTPSSYTINGLTAGTQYTINMVANIAANITATTTTTSSLSPTSITGCTLWLDAADSSTLVLSGSNVTQWNDKSNGGHNFTSSSGHYPVYSTNSISITGPAVANSANYQYLINTTIPFTTNYSIFCIGNQNVSHPTLYNFNVLIKAATTTNGQLLIGTDAAGNYASIVGPGSTVNAGSNNNTPLISVLSRSLMEVTNDGTSTGLLPYINGTVMDARNGTTTSFTGLTIGDTFWAGGSNNWNGNVNEILIYNSVLSTADRQKVEGYLAWKWGIQTSLPSNHPYYSAPPSTTTTTLGIVQNVKSNPSVPVTLSTLALTYLPYPPTDLSGNSTVISGQPYGNGTYTVSATVERLSRRAPYAFGTTSYWQLNPYPTTRTTVVSGTTYTGEWVQLVMPSSIVVKRYSLTTTSSNNPISWVIAGSTDGTTWYLLDYQNFTTIAGFTTHRFDISNSTSYNYYRFIYIGSNGTYPVLSNFKFYTAV